jgi:Arc/MetJ-type ribon-helix-helix transcriptional regulator
MNKKMYGYTSSGKPIDVEMIEQFVEEAEEGYDAGQFKEHRRGRGRPPLGDAAKVVGSLRLDPALRHDAELRASEEGVSVSELVRDALRKYLYYSQPSHNVQQHLVDDFQSYWQKLDGIDVAKHLASIDKWLVSEINQRFASVMSDYSKWLIQFSGAMREFNADFKRVMDSDIAALRDVTEKSVEKVQTSSTIQISRVKAFIEEAEKVLSRWDEISHQKSGKGH